MVTLHFPFRNEEEDVLAEIKFSTLYNENEALILERRKEFKSSLDMQKTIEACRALCREDTQEDIINDNDVHRRFPEANPFAEMYNYLHSTMNMDLRMATLNKLGATAKKKGEHHGQTTILRSHENGQ